jgi:hypothetical protein
MLCVGAVVSIVRAWPARADELCRAGNTLVAYVRALGCASEASAGVWGLRPKRAVYAAGTISNTCNCDDTHMTSRTSRGGVLASCVTDGFCWQATAAAAATAP